MVNKEYIMAMMTKMMPIMLIF